MTWRLVAVSAIAAALLGLHQAEPRAADTRTLKEQLSDKASDEQRVDNCNVPAEARGAVPRPDCAGKAPPASGPATAAPPPAASAPED